MCTLMMPKLAQYMPPKQQILMKKLQFTTSYKDDCSKIAELKQQISQKMILLRSTLCCELKKLSGFFINICCFGGMYWASLGFIKVHIKHPRETYHSASACRILSKLDHPRQSYDVIPFSRWRPRYRNTTSGFGFRDFPHLRRLKSIRVPNFGQISQYTAEI